MIRFLAPATAALCLLAAPATAQTRAFIAVEVADIAIAEAWYAQVFDARQVNSFSRPTFEQRILSSDDAVIELVQRIPPRSRPPEGSGLMKAGMVVADLDARIARWQAMAVEFRGRRIHDDALDLDAVLIVDPDGNLIQMFGRTEPAAP